MKHLSWVFLSKKQTLLLSSIVINYEYVSITIYRQFVTILFHKMARKYIIQQMAYADMCGDPACILSTEISTYLSISSATLLCASNSRASFFLPNEKSKELWLLNVNA